jgi:hypothetical protein
METVSKVYNIYFDESIDAVVMEWKGYATSNDFKEGTELMLNTLIRHNTFKVLADVKDMTIIAREDQEWLNAVFLPRATEFGFKVIAIIQPEQYFNKVAIESISHRIDPQKLSLRVFDNIEDAREWLSLVGNPYQ